jgi:hypothetical protein
MAHEMRVFARKTRERTRERTREATNEPTRSTNEPGNPANEPENPRTNPSVRDVAGRAISGLMINGLATRFEARSQARAARPIASANRRR